MTFAIIYEKNYRLIVYVLLHYNIMLRLQFVCSVVHLVQHVIVFHTDTL